MIIRFLTFLFIACWGSVHSQLKNFQVDYSASYEGSDQLMKDTWSQTIVAATDGKNEFGKSTTITPFGVVTIYTLFYWEDQEYIILMETGTPDYSNSSINNTYEAWQGKYKEDVNLAQFNFHNEAKIIQDYYCKKATITDESGKTTTYWYTTGLHRFKLHPFSPSALPGLVLEMTTVSGEDIVTIKANKITLNIDLYNYTIPMPDDIEIQTVE
jgi:GLPGLI family protein